MELLDGMISNKYILRDNKGIKVRRDYNNKVVGISLKGNVLDTKNDTVKINLEIDGNQDIGKARWFSYSTVYSSPDGTGWYCMPEVGDVIRLYFRDNEEKNAYAISSANLKSSNSEKRSDPAVKSIGTKYGKQVVMKPGAVEIIGNGNLLMRLTDDGGIEINSDKKIVLDAKEECKQAICLQEKQLKGEIRYIYFSLLRTSFLENKGEYRIDLYDENWILDKQECFINIDLNFIFASIFKYMEELKEKKKECGRSITDMDIENMMLEETDKYHVLAVEFLKGLIEKFIGTPSYEKMKKAEDIRIFVGEYTDETEMIYPSN
ncbi:hypothetical protein [Clostridium estertheticum]|nr:hypothetical protein [Clostridium estertheticum]